VVDLMGRGDLLVRGQLVRADWRAGSRRVAPDVEHVVLGVVEAEDLLAVERLDGGAQVDSGIQQAQGDQQALVARDGRGIDLLERKLAVDVADGRRRDDPHVQRARHRQASDPGHLGGDLLESAERSG